MEQATKDNDKAYDGFDIVRGDEINILLHNVVIPIYYSVDPQRKMVEQWLSLQTEEFKKELGCATVDECLAYYKDAYATETQPGRGDAVTLEECLQTWTDMHGGTSLR